LAGDDVQSIGKAHNTNMLYVKKLSVVGAGSWGESVSIPKKRLMLFFERTTLFVLALEVGMFNK